MASSDLYEMRFEWPHREPTTVIVTGTFDHWSRSVKLDKTESGFVASVRVPWAQKIKYKFIVDGQWLTQAGQPTEMDPGGFINNIYLTPPKPEPAPEAVKLNDDATHASASAPIESTPAETPVPEKPVEVAPEAPKEEKEVETKVNEQPVVDSTRSSRGSRISMPIIPVNAVEHNTIGSAPPPPAVPDYVLPPPPRARSASPPPVQEIKQAAVVTPEPEPAKLHEVEASLEPVLAIPPEVPIEEQKQEAISHIPVDDLPNAKPEFVPEAEDPTKEEDKQVVVPTPEPAKVETPVKEEEKATLPTPPATPSHSKKEFPLSSPSATPSGSPSSSRFGTAASKKKRRSSFFGKIKELFHLEKDKEKEKVKK